jgi:hypothetical protein
MEDTPLSAIAIAAPFYSPWFDPIPLFCVKFLLELQKMRKRFTLLLIVFSDLRFSSCSIPAPDQTSPPLEDAKGGLGVIVPRLNSLLKGNYLSIEILRRHHMALCPRTLRIPP